ncbi:MAG TPA: protein kinase [Kofleriaceae bacterium]|nr:protein kinase [Kofleriaceae bacterium]
MSPLPEPSRSDSGAPRARMIGNRYDLIQRLGRGGMGEVFRVVERSTGREVALKRTLDKSPAATMRFRREFHTMARLHHPNIVQVHDYGSDDEGPYYTMELLDGRDMRDLGPMAPQPACKLLRDVAMALAFLHSHRLLHRDLAARNVRCTSDGRAKLIDFGVLATFGVSDHIAGTPPSIAPESLRGLPLDHRADLFGLGALAYWLITGRHAFDADRIEDLEARWRVPPAAPSMLVAALPPGLDELILSLLRIDPLGRPSSAVEVVDRLTAIAGLPPVDDTDVTRGYVASAALVGRKAEMATVRQRLRKAVTGTGSLVVIEAPSGGGKSRLLREAVFEAQLAGASVISVDGAVAGHRPYGLVREIARRLLEVAPDDATSAARPWANQLREAIPELIARLSRVDRIAAGDASVITDPAEARLRVQAAINAWVLAVAARRPLALLIDDIQRCDEASAAVLAGLARSLDDRGLLILAALRTDEPARFPEAITAMLAGGSRVPLHGLRDADSEALVRELFGDVPRVAVLASWMHALTGGSPLHLTELAHYLVDRGIVSYHEGMWVLPTQPFELQVPADLKAAMDARLAQFEPMARALAETLAIHGGTISLALAVALAGDVGETHVFTAIDELVQREILIGDSVSYRFRHDGIREALLRGISDDRRRDLHLRIAETLSSAGAIAPEQEVEIGWHFYRGGAGERGAPLLERAGRRLFDAQAMSDALGPLDAAITTYRSRGGSRAAYLDLLFMIVMAGALSDRATALRHVDEALTTYQRYAGVALAARLGRYFGRPLALLVGLTSAALRWLVTPRRSRGPTPLVAMARYMMMVGHASYIHFATNNIAGLRAALTWMAPMNAFKKRAPYGAYSGQLGMLDVLLGRLRTGKERFKLAAASVIADRLTPATEFERRLIEAASRGFIVLAGVFQLDADVDVELARIKELDLRYFDFGARTATAIRHRLKGEEDEAQKIVAELEVTTLQLGASWHMEAMLVMYSSLAYALCRDMVGLKRCVEELHRLVAAGFQFEAQLALARGEYLRERGELDAADAALESAMAVLDPEEGTVRQWVLAARAEVALARGATERAREHAEQGLAIGRDPELGQVIPRLRAVRTLALAQASWGDLTGAAARVDEAIEIATALASPPLESMLHEARARIALLADDAACFDRHCAAAAAAVAPTRNPALIAACERLREAGRVATTSDPGHRASIADTVVTRLERRAGPLLADCRGPSERGSRLLEILLRASGGTAGYLYLIRGTELVLCAPAGTDAPTTVANAVKAVLDAMVVGSRPDPAEGPDTVVATPTQWHVGTLVTQFEGEARPVAVFAVRAGLPGYVPPDHSLLEDLGRELHLAGDVSAG